MLEINKIHLGHVIPILKQIDDESIDCCVTSPPYYGLRSYSTEPQIWLNGKEDCGDHKCGDLLPGHHPGQVPQTKIQVASGSKDSGNFCLSCGAWKGELGLEPTFGLYLEHLWQIFDEVKRVLKKTGTCFVNLGDSYSGSGGAHSAEHANPGISKSATRGGAKRVNQPNNIQPKSLLQIPSRFSIGMPDQAWILRNKIIWHKPSCMPSSARDRFTVDFEEIFFFTKSPKYYFEQQFEEQSDNTHSKGNKLSPPKEDRGQNDYEGWSKTTPIAYLPNGRNKRTVWSITSEPFSEAHFATFPQALVEPMIKAGCPEFICTKCGKAREKIYKPTMEIKKDETYSGKQTDQEKNFSHKRIQMLVKAGREAGLDHDNTVVPKEFIGYTDCKCGEEFKPGIVLDPFIGSGTTGIVAKKLNRNFIGIELQPNYLNIAEKRFQNEFGLFYEDITCHPNKK